MIGGNSHVSSTT